MTTLVKTCVEVKKVNEPSKKYLNYTCISCGLAHGMVACFRNVCVTEKEVKKQLTTYNDNFQDDYALTETNMALQVTCSLTLIWGDSMKRSSILYQINQWHFTLISSVC